MKKTLGFLFFTCWTLWFLYEIFKNAYHYSFVDWIIVICVFLIPFAIGYKIKNARNAVPNKTSEQQEQSDLFVIEDEINSTPRYSEEYLNEVLPNDKTIREQLQENLEEALSQPAPKRHSDYEESLITDFSIEFEQTLSLAEDKLYTLANSIYSSDDIDLQILKVRQVISHYEQFKDFCYSKGIGGTLYFQDMWEHCHNSKNPAFNYIDSFKERLEQLELRKWNMDEMAIIRDKLLQVIKEHPGILQKDIYAHFKAELKIPIRGELMSLEQYGTIRRKRYGSTYKLYLS